MVHSQPRTWIGLTDLAQHLLWEVYPEVLAKIRSFCALQPPVALGVLLHQLEAEVIRAAALNREMQHFSIKVPIYDNPTRASLLFWICHIYGNGAALESAGTVVRRGYPCSNSSKARWW